MLSRGEDYAFVRPSLLREKIRKLELAIGAERRKDKRNPVRIFATPAQTRALHGGLPVLDEAGGTRSLAHEPQGTKPERSCRVAPPPLERGRPSAGGT